MIPLSAAKLLNVWDQGADAPPYRKALLLLAAAYPEQSIEEMGRLSIGRRDGMLMELRNGLFGAEVDAIVGCPVCGEVLELNFSLTDLQSPPAPFDSLLLESGTYFARFRLPNSIDFEEVAAYPETARTRLLERCALSLSDQDRECSLSELPEELKQEVISRMDEADPQANIQLALNCSGCGHSWSAPFDIVSFLWREIEALVMQLFREIHLLARAYHWSEAEILGMSARRRRQYLEMIT
ncbi:MAG: phage baseplate protein [Blastocatellia bacterium]|nr:phage baseplate protein [Blastocatellia bacterium]